MQKNVKHSLFNSKMLNTSIALTGGRLFNMIVSLVLLLIQSRFIGPETTGRVAFFAIPLGYLWILTLGVPSALARELPYLIAKGETEKAYKFAQTAQTFSVFMGLLCATFFASLSVISLIRGEYFFAIGWAFQIVMSFFTIYNSFILTLYRTTDEFVKVAKANTISALSRILFFPLILIVPLFGLFIKPLASEISMNTYLHIKRPLRFKMGFDLKSFKYLLRFGMPLIVVGYVESNLWTSTQAALVVRLTDTTQLGLYNFIWQILILLLIIPNVVSEILRPKFSSIYGRTEGSVRETLKSAIKPLTLTFVFSLLAVAISWLFLGRIIEWLLPKYVEAIPALQIAILVLPIIAIKTVKYIFVVTKNITLNAISTIPGFLSGLLLLYYFLFNEFDFKYVFVPYIVGQFINLFITIVILMIMLKRKETKYES